MNGNLEKKKRKEKKKGDKLKVNEKKRRASNREIFKQMS